MRLRAPRLFAASVLLAVGSVSAVRAQSSVGDVPAPGPFLDELRATVNRFEDRSEAIRAGYRRLGPDFPGMGEHWVHPGRVMRGGVDPARPPILSYVVRNGRSTLVGLAFAVPLAPGEDPPAAPFGRDVWHDHTGSVDEEVLLLNHPSSMDGRGSGHRLSVVHAWTGVENPEGVLTQNNWALPFWRVGLRPPLPVSAEAARGVSLAFGGRKFYRALLHRAAELSPEEQGAVDRALAASASRSEEAVRRYRSDPSRSIVQSEFELIWREFWTTVRRRVSPEDWAALSKLSEAT